MSREDIVIATLVAYKALLIGIGFWASKKTIDTDDFFLGGRQLGPLVAAVSYSSSASSAWTMLGLSGIAYVLGLSSIWIALGSISGMFVAWYWIAPRLMTQSRKKKHITLTDFLLDGISGTLRRTMLWIISLIIVFSFIFYIAAQFQGAGSTFSLSFGLPINKSIIIGALIVMLYTLIGGFWAVSLTDTLQGILMAITAVLLPLTALVEIGGLSAFFEALRKASTPEQWSFTAANTGLYAIGAVLGSIAIGIGTFGQPHLLIRFMALRDEKALRQARLIATAWYILVFVGMLFVGLAGRILYSDVGNPETIFFVMTEHLFSPVLGAILLAAVLSAIMSTADSQLLVAAGVIAYDLGLGGHGTNRLLLASRLSIVVIVSLSILVSIYLPEKIFDRVLFAWIALGSAFGPSVFIRLASVTVPPMSILLSILCGFISAVSFHLMSDIPAIAAHAAPFALGLLPLLLANQKNN